MFELETKTRLELLSEHTPSADRFDAWIHGRWVSLDSLKALLAEQRKELERVCMFDESDLSVVCYKKDVKKLLGVLEERLK